MPILFRPLVSAPESYDQDGESRFRRGLENYLLELSSEVNGASSAQSTESSLASKREALILAPHGVETYPGVEDLESSYFFANNSISFTDSTNSKNGLTEYWSKPTSWTSRQADEWAEDGTSGDFEYTGAFPSSGSRRFLVSYSFNVGGYTTRERWRMMGRVRKTPSGGSEADVPGSIQSQLNYATVAFFAARLSSFQISCSVIVDVSIGDKISFYYGNYVDTAGTYNIQNTSQGDGVMLAIIPADLVS